MLITLIWVIIRIIFTIFALIGILLYILIRALVIPDNKYIKIFILYRIEDFLNLWKIEYLKNWVGHE